MVRQKEFDTEEVLDKAIDLFWKKGYTNTSVQDLVEHLGLARGSLYNTFQSKHALFLAALDRYTDKRNSALRNTLRDDHPRQAFERLFRSFVDEIMHDEDHKGCMIINTTTEMAASDPEIAEHLQRNQAQQVECFVESLEAARERGKIAHDSNPRALALFISNTMKGLRVMAKINPSREDLEAVVDTALQVLD